METSRSERQIRLEDHAAASAERIQVASSDVTQWIDTLSKASTAVVERRNDRSTRLNQKWIPRWFTGRCLCCFSLLDDWIDELRLDSLDHFSAVVDEVVEGGSFRGLDDFVDFEDEAFSFEGFSVLGRGSSLESQVKKPPETHQKIHQQRVASDDSVNDEDLFVLCVSQLVLVLLQDVPSLRHQLALPVVLLVVSLEDSGNCRILRNFESKSAKLTLSPTPTFLKLFLHNTQCIRITRISFLL
jgi:hypothetical protein